MTKPKKPRLYGAAEAAGVLGVDQTNVRRLQGIPKPHAVLKSGTVWLADDIDAFAAERRARVAAAA